MTRAKTDKKLKAYLSISEGSKITFVEKEGVGYMVIIYPTDDTVIIPLEDFALMVQAFHDQMLPPEGEYLN